MNNDSDPKTTDRRYENAMTVADLVSQLQTLPQHLPVFTRGFDETGFDPIIDPKVESIKRISQFSGHHAGWDSADAHVFQSTFDDLTPFDAVIIDFA